MRLLLEPAQRVVIKFKTIAILLVALCVKLASEWALVRNDPELTLSTLIGWLYPPFLLQACTAVGMVGLRWSDCGRALQILGWARFLNQTRIADLLPPSRRGVLLLEPRYGRSMATARMLRLEGDYYRSLPITTYF